MILTRCDLPQKSAYGLEQVLWRLTCNNVLPYAVVSDIPTLLFRIESLKSI
jgi:hypothetical protein